MEEKQKRQEMEDKQKRQAEKLKHMLHAAERERQAAMLEEKHKEQEQKHKQQADFSAAAEHLSAAEKKADFSAAERMQSSGDVMHDSMQRQEELARSRGGRAAEAGGPAPEDLGGKVGDKDDDHDPSASAQADPDAMMQYVSEARTGWEEYSQHTALHQLSGTCVRREEGWWHYEVCHGHNVTQYHPKDPACATCAPERTSVHLLGTFAGVLPFMAASQAQAQASSEAGSGAKYWTQRSQEGRSVEGSERKHLAEQQSGEGSEGEHGTIREHGTKQSGEGSEGEHGTKRNAEHGSNRKRPADRAAFQAHEGSDGKHAFVDGDTCGANAARRNTLVEYRCLAGAGAGLTDDRIEMIEEYQTCRYRIIFLTNKACNSSLQVSITYMLVNSSLQVPIC